MKKIKVRQMKTKALIIISAFFIAILLTSSVPKINEDSPKVNEYFLKRTLLLSSYEELETIYGKKFNYFEKVAIKKAKKRYHKEFKRLDMLNDCDLITLNSGEEISAIVMEVGTTEIKYKKCDNKNGPTYSLAKNDVFMIKYANGTKDIFGNQTLKNNTSGDKWSGIENENPTDGLAVASISTAMIGIIFAFVLSSLLGVIFGLIATVLGVLAADRIKKSKGKIKGKGFADAGVIIGGITLLLSIIVLAGLF